MIAHLQTLEGIHNRSRLIKLWTSYFDVVVKEDCQAFCPDIQVEFVLCLLNLNR